MMIRWLVGLIALLSFVGPCCAAGAAVPDYRLDTGDIISITVFDEKDLSVDKVKLGDADTIPYPMIGSIRVKGLTLPEVQKEVTAALKGTYLINPQVTVSIDQYRDIYINGQVNKPGNYPYQPGLTVREAVSIAGGFTDRANQDTVSIVREHHGKSDAVKGDQNTDVEPGDTITVNESFF